MNAEWRELGPEDVQGIDWPKRSIHWWDRLVRRIEFRNHRDREYYLGEPRWEWMCDLADWLTHGYAHD